MTIKKKTKKDYPIVKPKLPKPKETVNKDKTNKKKDDSKERAEKTLKFCVDGDSPARNLRSSKLAREKQAGLYLLNSGD